MLSGVSVPCKGGFVWAMGGDSSHQHQGHNYLTQTLGTAKSMYFITFITNVWEPSMWNYRFLLFQLGWGPEGSTSCFKPVFLPAYLTPGAFLLNPGSQTRREQQVRPQSDLTQVLNFTHNLLSGVHSLGLVIPSLAAKAKHEVESGRTLRHPQIPKAPPKEYEIINWVIPCEM